MFQNGTSSLRRIYLQLYAKSCRTISNVDLGKIDATRTELGRCECTVFTIIYPMIKYNIQNRLINFCIMLNLRNANDGTI